MIRCIQYCLQGSECNGLYAKCMLMQPEPNDHDVRNDGDSEDEQHAVMKIRVDFRNDGDSEDEQHAARKIRVEDRCDEQR